MKEMWTERVRDLEIPDKEGKVFAAFNTDVDLIVNLQENSLGSFLEKLDREDVKQGMKSPPRCVGTLEEFASSLLKSMKAGTADEVNAENREIVGEIRDSFEISGSNVGGQAGISANFLSDFTSTILYTPYVSEEQARHFDREVLYPTVDDGKLELKEIRNFQNTENTKSNLVFEYGGGLGNQEFEVNVESPGRFIVSDLIPGYRPCFPEEIADRFKDLFGDIDRVFLSGYHSLREDYENTLEEASKQIEDIKRVNPDTKIHLEFVAERDRELQMKIVEKIANAVHSVGCDPSELDEIRRILGLGGVGGSLSDISLQDVVQSLDTLMEELNLERFHIHTKNFLCVATQKEYGVGPEKIRDSLIFGGYAAVAKTKLGRIPRKEDLEREHDFHFSEEGVGEMARLQQSLDLGEKFPEEGIAEIDGLNVVVVPTLLAERKGKLVGLGDIISSGGFFYEITD